MPPGECERLVEMALAMLVGFGIAAIAIVVFNRLGL